MSSSFSGWLQCTPTSCYPTSLCKDIGAAMGTVTLCFFFTNHSKAWDAAGTSK